jgi:hypothetical protein
MVFSSLSRAPLEPPNVVGFLTLTTIYTFFSSYCGGLSNPNDLYLHLLFFLFTPSFLPIFTFFSSYLRLLFFLFTPSFLPIFLTLVLFLHVDGKPMYDGSAPLEPPNVVGRFLRGCSEAVSGATGALVTFV